MSVKSLTSELVKDDSMPLEMPFVYVFKFPFYTNVCMLTLSYLSCGFGPKSPKGDSERDPDKCNKGKLDIG
jgi:hypothetical protein